MNSFLTTGIGTWGRVMHSIFLERPNSSAANTSLGIEGDPLDVSRTAMQSADIVRLDLPPDMEPK